MVCTYTCHLCCLAFFFAVPSLSQLPWPWCFWAAPAITTTRCAQHCAVQYCMFIVASHLLYCRLDSHVLYACRMGCARGGHACCYASVDCVVRKDAILLVRVSCCPYQPCTVVSHASHVSQHVYMLVCIRVEASCLMHDACDGLTRCCSRRHPQARSPHKRAKRSNNRSKAKSECIMVQRE
jgi:hypothetical protein